MIFGTNAKTIKIDHINDVNCKACQGQDTIDAVVFSKYFHILWIPTFPLGKQAVTRCSNCKNTLKEKEMDRNLKVKIGPVKDKSKIPFYHFSGLAILAVFIIIGIIGDKNNNEENLKYLENPKVGDFYDFKTEDGDYTKYRVHSIVNDSLFFDINQYTVNKITGLGKINKPENYFGPARVFTINEIKDKYEKKIILDIDRE